MKTCFILTKAFIWLTFLFLANPALSQVETYHDYQLIREQGFNNSNLREKAVQLTDAIGPRISGTIGFNNSLVWAEKTLEEYELDNVRIEAWGEFGHGWKMEKFYIAMTQPYYQPLIAVPQAWTGNTDGLTQAEVILVTANTMEELKEYSGKLNGKIVITPYLNELEVSFDPLASRITDEDMQRYDNIANFRPDPDPYIQERRRMTPGNLEFIPYVDYTDFCQVEGAIAILENSGSYGAVRSVGNRHGRFLDELGIPIIDMTHEHYARMVRLIDRDISVEIELEVSNTLITDNKVGFNVFAEIKGYDKKLRDEVVMIGAHLDSWHAGTGGNDNASGVILMMEVMRILKESGVQLNRTVRLALWGAEEQGLLGSRNWAKENVYDLETNTKGTEFDKISAYYNFDYGTGKIRGIFLHDNFALKPIFEEFFKPVSDLGVSAMSMRNPGSSDHVVFNRLGIPGFAFIQDRIDYVRGYHTNMDTFERIQLGDLKQAAVVVATLVYQTANHPERLPRRDVFLED